MMCLGWYHGLLYPTIQNDGHAVGDVHEEQPDTNTEDSSSTLVESRKSSDNDWDMKSGIKRLLTHPKRTRMYRSIVFKFRQLRRSFTPPNTATPKIYHPLFHPSLPQPARLALLTLYDATLIALVAIHIYIYISSIDPGLAFCDTYQGLPTLFSLHERGQSARLRKSEPSVVLELTMKEKCQRLNWTIHGAGGVAGVVAANLAVLHLAAMLCRFCECAILAWEQRTVEREKKYVIEWQDPRVLPRDVDIHARVTHAAMSLDVPGRLTRISEEEVSVGGSIRRRTDKSVGNQSSRTMEREGEEGRLEGMLLECLVP